MTVSILPTYWSNLANVDSLFTNEQKLGAPKFKVGDKLVVTHTDAGYSPSARAGMTGIVDRVESGITMHAWAYGFVNTFCGGLYFVKEQYLEFDRPEGDDWI